MSKNVIKFSMLALTFALMSFSVMLTSPIVWKSEQIDLGEIPQNVPKSIDFEFTNQGNAAVTITDVKASCGCTATNYTKTVIQPGETAKVTATYNAAAKGAFSKNVTVTTTAEETPKVLSFKGTVN
ncbi:MAG: DUF1573 domain-containing protein [Bacteroidota bacterium]